MMRRKLAAILGAALMLSLCACGRKSPVEEPAESATPELPTLAEQDFGPVTEMIKTLSAKQMELLTGSIEVVSGALENDGVTVSLVSAMGDGCYNCFNVLVSLPEKSKNGCAFESAELLFNDAAAPFETTGSECALLEDENPEDGSYSLRVTVGTTRWEDRDYSLNTGAARTLRLKNIVDGSGRLLKKGEWSFDFKYLLESTYKELVKDPMPVAASAAAGKEDWAKLSSVILSGFSIECRFELGSGESEEPFSYGLAYVELKNGERSLIGCDSRRTESGVDIRDYYLLVPIAPDEVKCIHLADRLTIDAD